MVRKFNNIPPWTLTILCILLILWLTLAPRPLGEIKPPLFYGADKIAHAIMFGGLVFCVAVDRYRSKQSLTTPYLLTTALFSSLFGIAIEFMQRIMQAGRGFEITDMIADTAGAFLVAVGIILYKL